MAYSNWPICIHMGKECYLPVTNDKKEKLNESEPGEFVDIKCEACEHLNAVERIGKYYVSYGEEPTDYYLSIDEIKKCCWIEHFTQLIICKDGQIHKVPKLPMPKIPPHENYPDRMAAEEQKQQDEFKQYRSKDNKEINLEDSMLAKRIISNPCIEHVLDLFEGSAVRACDPDTKKCWREVNSN